MWNLKKTNKPWDSFRPLSFKVQKLVKPAQTQMVFTVLQRNLTESKKKIQIEPTSQELWLGTRMITEVLFSFCLFLSPGSHAAGLLNSAPSADWLFLDNCLPQSLSLCALSAPVLITPIGETFYAFYWKFWWELDWTHLSARAQP